MQQLYPKISNKRVRFGEKFLRTWFVKQDGKLIKGLQQTNRGFFLNEEGINFEISASSTELWKQRNPGTIVKTYKKPVDSLVTEGRFIDGSK